MRPPSRRPLSIPCVQSVNSTVLHRLTLSLSTNSIRRVFVAYAGLQRRCVHGPSSSPCGHDTCYYYPMLLSRSAVAVLLPFLLSVPTASALTKTSLQDTCKAG